MTNIKLTYEYTLDSIKVINASIDRIRSTFTSLIAVSGVLANFGKDLPGYQMITNCEYSRTNYPCLSCYILKIIAYICLIFTIAIALKGLSPKTNGKIILPEQLICNEWNEIDEDDYLYSLVEYLEKETLLVLNKFRDYEAKRLNQAIWFLGATVILFGLDEILGSSLTVLGQSC